ncbi:MAG: hypothetical protein EA417_13840 [Gammaproteobacteria bacterium]|nr:MAG: hypothetical protein EA417_13840 [Gammaproteobacteria bacterium]
MPTPDPSPTPTPEPSPTPEELPDSLVGRLRRAADAFDLPDEILAYWEDTESRWAPLPITPEGYREIYDPLAQEAERGVQGRLLSAVTSRRDHTLVIEIETPLLPLSEVRQWEDRLGTGLTIEIDGRIVPDGPIAVVADPPETVWATVPGYAQLRVTFRQA